MKLENADKAHRLLNEKQELEFAIDDLGSNLLIDISIKKNNMLLPCFLQQFVGRFTKEWITEMMRKRLKEIDAELELL